MSTAARAELRPRSRRLVARVTDEQRTLFQRAAEVQGRTLSDFVVATVQEAAARAVRDHAAIQLDVEASRAFVEEMLSPSPLPPRLAETIQLYRERAGG